MSGKRAEKETESEEDEPASARWTAMEVEEIKMMIEGIQTWFQEQIKAIEGQPKNVDAPFRALDLDLRGSNLQKRILRLMNRKPPKPKPKKSTTSTTPSPTEASTESMPEQTQPREDL